MLDVPASVGAAYLQKWPGVTPEAARADAAAYLGLPPITRPLPFFSFDAKAFSVAAGADFDAYVSSLAGAMARAERGPQSFLRADASPTTNSSLPRAVNALLARPTSSRHLLSCFLFICSPDIPLTVDQEDVDVINGSASLIDDLAGSENVLMQQISVNGLENNYLAGHAGLVPLVDLNWGLLHDYLVTSQLTPSPAGTPAADDPVALRMQAIKNDLARLSNGVDLWNTTLAGPGGNGYGLIQVVSQTLGRTGRFYGPKEATLMANWWAAVDAEQATTAYLAVKFAAMQGRTDGPAILAAWKQNRRAQLALLRGMSKSSDDFESDITLNALPPGIAILKSNRTMWNVSPTIIRPKGTVTNEGAMGDMQALYQDWRIPTVDDGMVFTNSPSDPNFATELENEGFAESDDEPILFTRDAVAVKSHVTVGSIGDDLQQAYSDLASTLFNGSVPHSTYTATYDFQFIVDGLPGLQIPETDIGGQQGMDFNPSVFLHVTRNMGANEPMPFWP